jgi:hypothetical protein
MSMAIHYPDVIEEDGSLAIHSDGAFAGAPLFVREGGVITDLSTTPLFFEIPAIGFRRVLAAHPTDTKGRWIPALTKAECASIPNGAKWVIFDESSGQPVDLYGATIRRYR